MIEYRFKLLDAYIDVNALPTFVVADEPVKEKFQELLDDLANHNLMAKIRRVSDKLVISVFPKPKLGKPRNSVNLVLFLATIGTVLAASYVIIFNIPVFGFQLFNIDPRLDSVLFANMNRIGQFAVLAIGIMGISGLHELGHLIAVRHHRMAASLPYFLPVPPPSPFGTFGAVISLRAPPRNRDQLFDLGFSGPIAGFLATLGVAVVMILTAPIISNAQTTSLVAQNLLQTTSWPYDPLLFDLVSQMGLRTVPAGYALILPPFTLAVEFGALITFLNLVPVWQLDGGHISRAVLGDKGHRWIALVAFAILLLTGAWFFAVLLIVVMFLGRRPLEGLEPLDDLSPLSNTRKALFGLSLVILALTVFVIAPL
jgi:membrane-associated protease RseP (regulator of RpoE activity)